MNKNIVIVSLIAVAAAGGAFFAGMQFGQNSAAQKRAQFGQDFINQKNMMPGAGGRNMGGMVSGEILAIDAESLTVKTQNGSSKIVFFSPSVKLSKSVDAAASDLAVGGRIMASGTANNDGSIMAKTIQIGGAPFDGANKPDDFPANK